MQSGRYLMDQSKYGKYFISCSWAGEPEEKSGQYKNEKKITYSFEFLGKTVASENILQCSIYRISPPFNHRTLYKSAHIHDIEQVMLFLSIGPDTNLGGDVEIYLGAEGEKHTFNKNTIVYIPRLLQHCPIYFNNFENGREFYLITYYVKPNKP